MTGASAHGVKGYIDAIGKLLGKHLNTWDEICLDENARLRATGIASYAAITVICYVLVFLNLDSIGLFVRVSCLVLGTASALFFFLQLKQRQVCITFSLFYFSFALVMSVGFILTSGERDFSVLWVMIFPYIAYQIFNEVMALLFSVLLLIITLFLFFTPALDEHFFNLIYAAGFKRNFVSIMCFATFSALLSHLMRMKTQQRLIAIMAELKTHAYKDSLTGVGNRHDYERFLNDKEAGPEDVCYALLDIDYFKRVNDTWGHEVGDEVLKSIGKTLLNSVREDDQIFRWGGEEFLLIVLGKMSLDSFEKYLDRIRMNIEQAKYAMEDGTLIRVTVSIGGAYGGGCHREGECIQRADICLYEAKRRGRNRVVVSEMTLGISLEEQKKERERQHE